MNIDIKQITFDAKVEKYTTEFKPLLEYIRDELKPQLIKGNFIFKVDRTLLPKELIELSDNFFKVVLEFPTEIIKAITQPYYFVCIDKCSSEVIFDFTNDTLNDADYLELKSIYLTKIYEYKNSVIEMLPSFREQILDAARNGINECTLHDIHILGIDAAWLPHYIKNHENMFNYSDWLKGVLDTLFDGATYKRAFRSKKLDNLIDVEMTW